MTEPNNVCVDRQFYESAYPGAGFEEARAILIGMYLEKELEPAKQQQLKLHLEKCVCCSQFLGELEKIGEFKSATDPVAYAFCPSSEKIDIFVFDRRSGAGFLFHSN